MMRKLVRLFFVLVTGALATACGSDSSDGSPSSGGANSTGGGSSSGSGKACTIGAQICNFYGSATMASAVEMACTQGNGVLSDHCSSTSLSGCCAQASATICYYQISSTDSLQSACTKAGGTWGTTPP